MRLQEYDLTMACNRMLIKTAKKYAIIPTKSEYWYWSLELKNKDTWELESIAWSLTLREAYEYLRAFYRGLEYSKILDINNK